MDDWIKRLHSLKELRDAGILSEGELQAERDKIMRARSLRAASLDGPLAPGTVIGQHRVLSMLGEGGMGRVYRVEHQDPEFAAAEGPRALKVMSATLMGEPELIRRFKQEALKGVKIRHHRMAQVFQFIELDGVVGFLMELIEGDTLASRAPMPFAEALAALEPLAEMLDHLHALGVVHRDVKPENVKLHPTRGPVLLDFGIAKDAGIDMTMTMRAMGTPLYMSPEQLNARAVTGASDQYALALMFYYLVSQRFPWPTDSSIPQIIAAKIANELDARALEGVDEDVGRALARALATSPLDRYPSCGALCAALRALPPRRPTLVGTPAPRVAWGDA
ncbi:MAG: serine/threonine protein kinase, partial [Deltaproteobacteria bacterium]|nr:serine/threonine protein kinase [Deltaproteobacteria bacterium]